MKLHKLNNKRIFVSQGIINIAAYSKSEVVGDVHTGVFSLFDIFGLLRSQAIIRAYQDTYINELRM